MQLQRRCRRLIRRGTLLCVLEKFVEAAGFRSMCFTCMPRAPCSCEMVAVCHFSLFPRLYSQMLLVTGKGAAAQCLVLQKALF